MTNKKNVSAVVFVHGWLHSAEVNDGNLKSFRLLLGQLARIEADGPCKREVIGLYVGWRGAGTIFADHPQDTLTFWSRKLAAEHVATGSFQQVLAGIKAIQSKAPDTFRLDQLTPGDADCSARLKTTYIGHSFGGLIVMTSLAQDLARGLMRDRVNMESWSAFSSSRTRSPDELVIVINPAVESARFDALYRVATAIKYPAYRSPRFISITSINDWPTRKLFPIGRLINSATKKYPDGDASGRVAARKTIGHDRNYITHELDTFGGHGPLLGNSICEEWHSVSGPYYERAKIEIKMASKFHADNGGKYDARLARYWPRTFCSRRNKEDEVGILFLRRINADGPDGNSPIWNVQTRKPILDSHTDITNVRLLDFLRQVYIDTMYFQ